MANASSWHQDVGDIQDVAGAQELGGALAISCEDCVMRDTDACHDCLVSFLCGPVDTFVAGDRLRFDPEERRVVGLLSGAGLVPRLRHVQRAS